MTCSQIHFISENESAPAASNLPGPPVPPLTSMLKENTYTKYSTHMSPFVGSVPQIKPWNGLYKHTYFVCVCILFQDYPPTCELQIMLEAEHIL